MAVPEAPASSTQEPASQWSTPHRGAPWLAAAIVLTLGLVATTIVTLITWNQYNDAERRLLLLQTRQAGAVVQAAIPSAQVPLQTAAQLAATTEGRPSDFRRYMRAYVGGPRGLLACALWLVHGRHVKVLATLGPGAALRPPMPMITVAHHALRASTFVVIGQPLARPDRLDYADAVHAASGSYVVFAERRLPRGRHARVASNAAFSGLRYAIYLGHSTREPKLIATNFPSGEPSGLQDIVRVPFGTSELTLVTSPVSPLAGNLPARRPWILATAGLLLSAVAALLVLRLVNRSRAAEQDAEKIRALNDELRLSYAEQRTISLTLQRSLLPARTPEVEGLEVAVRYIPGSEGAEVGGDWYSVLPLPDSGYCFVIGDVSGRGVRAAAVMAAVRFTIRTLLLEGHSPSDVLATCAEQTHELVGDQLATVLVGIGDLDRQVVTLASAGHLRPLVIEDGVARYVDATVGVPLGTIGRSYKESEVPLGTGATLLAFTDGLVERRGENLSLGLDRLTRAALDAPVDLEELVSHVCSTLTAGSEEDDVAILAIRPT